MTGRTDRPERSLPPVAALATLLVGDDPPVVLPVRVGETLEAAFVRAGFARRRKGCRRGGCGQCLMTVTKGTVVDERPVADSVLGPDRRAAGGALACRSVPTSDVVVVAAAGQIRCVSPLQRELADRELARVVGPAVPGTSAPRGQTKEGS